jgi:hypothetical protein
MLAPRGLSNVDVGEYKEMMSGCYPNKHLKTMQSKMNECHRIQRVTEMSVRAETGRRVGWVKFKEKGIKLKT